MEELLIESGKFLAQIVAETAFKFWQEEKFRKLINFDSISQTEQDRIFNELEVSLLGLFVLEIESLKMQIEDEEKTNLLTRLQTYITDGFLLLNRELGVDERFIDTWQTLIQMRLAEYQEDFKMLLEESGKDPKFDLQADIRFIWARTQVINLDCLTHVRRGNLEQSDPLRRYQQKWIIEFDQTFGENFKSLVFQPQGYA